MTEKLITEAFQRQAERAPDGGRVLAALHAAERAHDTRRTWLRRSALAMAAAAVVAAIAVPVSLLGGESDGNSGNTGAPANPPTVRPAPGATAMPFRPTIIPNGFTERMRWAGGPNGEWGRLWSDQPRTDAPGYPSVQLWYGPRTSLAHLPDASHTVEDVTIKGAPGKLVEDRRTNGRTVDLYWYPLPDKQFKLMLSNVDTARKIATGADDPVTLDPSAALDPVLAAGWLPPGTRQGQMTVIGYPGRTEITMDGRAGPTDLGPAAVTMRVTDQSQPPVSNGDPVLVRGSEGRYTEVAAVRHLVVRLPDSRWLLVSTSERYSREDLVRVADGLTIQPSPSFGWLTR
ncbi:hypothetical protein EV193_114112 [Herbihabitans rhizosphaerae]|uniref:Uncharacterized protein n=1 Tax=Herbihabitans rhizosphaerae TaxID=1872711 RepID=A0A4Q7KEX4_9PSEU|nr:hypothetical protein [Herbihabitans rhizosphaerae]RZS31420.1 hypothetical protein EV193_114112 [Herbihabitans rhizosphaerae]